MIALNCIFLYISEIWFLILFSLDLRLANNSYYSISWLAYYEPIKTSSDIWCWIQQEEWPRDWNRRWWAVTVGCYATCQAWHCRIWSEVRRWHAVVECDGSVMCWHQLEEDQPQARVQALEVPGRRPSGRLGWRLYRRSWELTELWRMMSGIKSVGELYQSVKLHKWEKKT